MTGDETNRDSEWEDLVRRLGGNPEKAAGEPPVEERYDTQRRDYDAWNAEDQYPVVSRPGPRDYVLAEEETLDFHPPLTQNQFQRAPLEQSCPGWELSAR